MKMGAQIVTVGDLRVGLWLHTSGDPRPDEWSAACRNVEAFAHGLADLSQFRALIVTDGGTPDARQRKELYRDALRGYPAKVSVVTDAVTASPLKRGIATALTWMNPNFRVFESVDLDMALQHIDLDLTRFGPLWDALSAMQRSLEPVVTLNRMAARVIRSTDSSDPRARDGGEKRPALSTPAPRSFSEPPGTGSSGVLRAARASSPSRRPRESEAPAERQSAARQRAAEAKPTGNKTPDRRARKT